MLKPRALTRPQGSEERRTQDALTGGKRLGARLQQEGARSLGRSPHLSPAPGTPGLSAVSRPGLQIPQLFSSDFSDSTWSVTSLEFGSSPSVKQNLLFPQTCHMSNLIDESPVQSIHFSNFQEVAVLLLASPLFYFVFSI